VTQREATRRWATPTIYSLFAISALLGAALLTSMAVSTGGGFGVPSAAAPNSNPLTPLVRQPGCAQGTEATALLIPVNNSKATVQSGDHVTITFEFAPNSWSVPLSGIQVFTPTLFATLPEVGGGDFQITFNNHTFKMTGPEWTTFSYSKIVSTTFTFDGAKNATLSSQKIGVMANTPYGTLKLKWRWNWNVTDPNGSFSQGPWSVPTPHVGTDSLPSIFEPAPYVQLVSSSPANEWVGSNYTVALGGDVAGRSFYLEFENSTGSVKAQKWWTDNSTSNQTFDANITLIGAAGQLAPGHYLVHVHDSCLALLYSKRVTVSYGPYALIHIGTTPAGCGTVTINGTAYVGGQIATIRPAPQNVSFGFDGCKGYEISNHTQEGAIHVDGPGLITVNGNGTLIGNFRLK
jgi:hypothetical protein